MDVFKEFKYKIYRFYNYKINYIMIMHRKSFAQTPNQVSAQERQFPSLIILPLK